jgi:Tol biopolymer transport system component
MDEEFLTSPGTMVGTVAYMSPEQVRGKELDARSDLFSFGAVLYEMATGALPFRGETSAMICEAIVNRAPVAAVRLNSELPAELERIINKALEKDRDLRYRSAADLETDLKRLRRDTDSGRTATTILPAIPNVRSRRWLKWSAIPLLLLVAGAFLLWLRTPLPPPRLVAAKQITSDGLPKIAFVTDGNRIYFTENPPTRLAAAQVSVGGGETAPIDTPIENPIIVDVSTERSELLLGQLTTQAGEGGLWSMPVPAGSPRRLGNVMARAALWAPNGKLVFATGNDLDIAEHDGSNPRKLFTTSDPTNDISVSPDGKRIRFTVANFINGTSMIWEVRSDGGDPHPLFPGWNNPAAECCGRWTPDGRYYFFQATRDGASNVWVVPDHSEWWQRKISAEPVQVTTGPLEFGGPVPSRDGKKLFVGGIQPRAELVRYDAKSGDFVPYLGGISAGDVDFSRDGQWVTYVSYPEDILWRSKLDGSTRLQLTYAPMRAALAHWSPDGQQIAFSGASPGKPWKLFLISKDGGSPQPLTSEDAIETDPTWTPDGSSLAFGHYDPFRPEKTHIELMNFKTHQLSQLPGSQAIFGPRWSPDGHSMIALSSDGNKLMLYDVKNEKWRQLNTSVNSFGYIAWSADSAYVYFDTVLSSNSGYFRLRISDSKLEKVADLKKVRQFPGQFGPGSWTGLGPGDTLLIPRDISTQEIYAFDLQLP